MKKIIIETGQNLVDIAIQEHGELEAIKVICKDNSLAFDAELSAGQVLLIREPGVDEMTVHNETIVKAYQRKIIDGKPYLVNSRTPSESEVDPGEIIDLPTFYGSGPVDLDAEGILALTKIFRKKKETENVPYVADMERLWYVYPVAFGSLSHAFQTGGYDAITSFEVLTIELSIESNDVNYYALRLKHDTYLTADDNLKISFE